MGVQGEVQVKWKYRSYKACLVTRGDEQIEGFDYNEIFVPMAKMNCVRISLSVAAARAGKFIIWCQQCFFTWRSR